jgi:branched-chain amino acid transport system ATP-binding protein
MSAAANGDVASESEPLLRVRGLGAGYGKLQVLRNIDLDVTQGEILSIVGPNGAGKSSLLKAISGEIEAVTGSVVFGGTDITTWNVRRRVAAGMIQVPENRHLFPGMRVIENLELGGLVNPKGASARLEEVLDLFPILRERSHQRAGQLSGGQQQMLAIGRGLMTKPNLLLLDEPTMGLAPKIVEDLFGTLSRLSGTGTTVVLVEQYVKVALRTADRCIVLRDGEVKLSGDSADISADPQGLHDAYFGTGAAASS